MSYATFPGNADAVALGMGPMTGAGQRSSIDNIQLPQYRCHKKVWALQIKAIEHKPNPDTTGQSAAMSYSALLVPVDSRYAPIDVPAEYMTKHRPEVGGYYVVYEDGYKSYSPAGAFESGYTLID